MERARPEVRSDPLFFALCVRDRARECLVMSCAENGGSIPTHVGAVSRRVREEAGGGAPFRRFFW